MTLEGWFIHSVEQSNECKGPFQTVQMEDFASRGRITAATRISHPKYTKGRVVEAQRIARFFNIFANVSEENALTVQKSNSPPPIVATVVSERDEEVTGIGRFMADGQDPGMICKLAERVDGICTAEEYALYMAVQQRPIANFSPDAVVLTNRRAIIFRQKVLGRLYFVDAPWLHVADVHLKEDILGSTITVRGLNGHSEEVSYLPKAQARKVYRIAQEMEEKMVELRRQRHMEETRAGAMSVTVNNDIGGAIQSATPLPAKEDPLAALKTLKGMLDAGLIEQSEFETKKAEILARM